jgi:hypothetical protein
MRRGAARPSPRSEATCDLRLEGVPLPATVRLVDEEVAPRRLAAVHIALAAGFPPEQLVFPATTRASSVQAARAAVGRTVVDSFDEPSLGAFAEDGLTPAVLLRPPGIEATHGM